MLIAPQPGLLKWAHGQVPTPLGPVTVNVTNGVTFKVEVNVPSNSKARVVVPRRAAGQVLVDGKPVAASAGNQTLIVGALEPGRHVIESR